MDFTLAAVGAITVAATAKLMHIIFLSGRTLSGASAISHFVKQLQPAAAAFADGWRRRDWRYLAIACPSMLATAAGVSAFLYWMLPVISADLSFWDKLKYYVLLFSAGITASLFISFILILAIYLALICLGAWLAGFRKGRKGEDAKAGPKG